MTTCNDTAEAMAWLIIASIVAICALAWWVS